MNQDNITPSILRFTRVSSSSFTSFQSLGPIFSSPHLYRFESTALPRSQNAPWWNHTHQFQWWPLRLVRHSLRYESVVPDPRHASLEFQKKTNRGEQKLWKKTPHFIINLALPESHIHHWNLENQNASKNDGSTWLKNALKTPSPTASASRPLSLPGTARTRAYDF